MSDLEELRSLSSPLEMHLQYIQSIPGVSLTTQNTASVIHLRKNLDSKEAAGTTKAPLIFKFRNFLKLFEYRERSKRGQHIP